jgi:V/A-type H+/Na+-transporting ATPase subunit E
MSNLEYLTSKILEDGNNKAQSILEEAAEEESKILNKSRNEAEKKRKEILDRVMEEGKLKKDRIISNAELEVRNNKLSAKQEVIGRVFNKAVEELRNLSKDQYLSFIRNTILSAPIHGDEVMVISPEDRQSISESFVNEMNMSLKLQGKKGEITLSKEDRSLNGGFMLIRSGIEINYTFNAIVASIREDLENEVAKILFS